MRKLKAKGTPVSSASDQSRNFAYTGRNPRLPEASGYGRQMGGGDMVSILPPSRKEAMQELKRQKTAPGRSKGTVRKMARQTYQASKRTWKAANPGQAFTKYNQMLRREE